MKGDTVLTEGDRYEIFEEKGSFNMEIYDTLPSDSGTYTCVASNAHGTVKCSAELLIADGDELEAAEDQEGMFARKALPTEEEEEEISSEGTAATVTESHAFSEDQEVRSTRVPSIPSPVRRVPPPEPSPVAGDHVSPVLHGTGVAVKVCLDDDDDEPALHAGGLAKPAKLATKPKWPRAQKGPSHARVVVLDESSGRLDLDDDEPEDSEVHAGKVLFTTERGKASDVGPSSSRIKSDKPATHDDNSFVHPQPKQLLTPSSTPCQDTHMHASLSQGGGLERPELHRVDQDGASQDFHTGEDTVVSVDHTYRVVGSTAGSGDLDMDLDTRNAAQSKKQDSDLRQRKSKDLDVDIDTAHEVYAKPSAGLKVLQKTSSEEYAKKTDIDNELEKQRDTQRKEYPKPRKTVGDDAEKFLDVDRPAKPEKYDDEMRKQATDNLGIELDSQKEVYPETSSSSKLTPRRTDEESDKSADHKPGTIAGLRMTTKLEEEEYPQMVHTNDLEIHMSAQRETYPKPAKATIIPDRTTFEKAMKSADHESKNGFDLRPSKELKEEKLPKSTDDLEIQMESQREVYPTRITPRTTYQDSTKSSDHESENGLDLRPSKELGKELPKSPKPTDNLAIQLDSQKEVYPTRISQKTTYEESTKSAEEEPERGVVLKKSAILKEEEYIPKSSKPTGDLEIQLDSEKEVYPHRITQKTTYEESTKIAEPVKGVGLRVSTKLEEEEYPQKSSKPTDDLEIQLDSEREVYPTRITQKTTYEESTKSSDKEPERDLGLRTSAKLEEAEYPKKLPKSKDDLEVQLDSHKEVYPTRISQRAAYEESTKSADEEPERGLRTSTKLEEDEYPKKLPKPTDDLEVQLDSQKEVYPTRITQKTRYEESTKSVDEEPERGVGIRVSEKPEEEYPQKSSKPTDVTAQIETDREESLTSADGIKISQKTYEESTPKDASAALKPDYNLQIQRKSDKEDTEIKTTAQPPAKPGLKQKTDYAESSRGTPDHEQQSKESIGQKEDVSMRARILQLEPSKETQVEPKIETSASLKPKELSEGMSALTKDSTADLEAEDKFEDAEESQVPSSQSLSRETLTPSGRESIIDAAMFKAITPDADKSSSTVSTPSVLGETELHDEDLSPYVSADEEQTAFEHHVQLIPTTPSDHVTSLPSAESVPSHQKPSAITPSTSQSGDEVSVTFKGKQEPLSGEAQRQTDTDVTFDHQREPSLQIRGKGMTETRELRDNRATVGSLEGQEISFKIKGDGKKLQVVGLPQLELGQAVSSEVVIKELSSPDEVSTSFSEQQTEREPGRATEADSRREPSYTSSSEGSEDLESSTEVEALFKEPMQRRTSGELIFDSRERLMQKAKTVLSSLAEKGLQHVAKIQTKRRADDTDGRKLVSPVQSKIREQDEKEKELTDRFASREASSIIDDVLKSEEMSRLLGLKAGEPYSSEEALHEAYSSEDRDETSSVEEIHSHLYHSQGIEDLAHAASELELDTGKETQKSFVDSADIKGTEKGTVSKEAHSPRVVDSRESLENLIRRHLER
uniref:Myosin light chain kinase n=1 Tax=Branchiostoma belcheri TaxID=7741 RepID=Q8IU22_BRABE|nr:myosin light chain kinase [Branchiostoma belcheri]